MNVKDGIEADATVFEPRTIATEAPSPTDIGMESLVRPVWTTVVLDVPVVSVTFAGEVASTTTQTVSES